MNDKRVLTFQDISCLGQCSLTVALPIISACGIETVILPSAVLSNHTAFKSFTFTDLTKDIRGITDKWQELNESFDCLYTGYLGSVEQIDYVLNIKNQNIAKDGLLIVDPAMADNGYLYTGFDDSFIKAMGRLCGQADIILPNITEAAFITQSNVILDKHTPEYIDELLNKLSKLGAKKIILKGIIYEEGKIGVVTYDVVANEKKYYFTKKLPGSLHGTGDCYASAFTGALMNGFNIYDAASLAADFVVECIKNTKENHWYGVSFEKALPMLIKKIN